MTNDEQRQWYSAGSGATGLDSGHNFLANGPGELLELILELA